MVYCVGVCIFYINCGDAFNYKHQTETRLTFLTQQHTPACRSPWLPVQWKECLPTKKRREAIKPNKALLATVWEFITFPDMLAKTTEKAFLLIYLSFNGVAILSQTRRDITSHRIIRQVVVPLLWLKTRLAPFLSAKRYWQDRSNQNNCLCAHPFKKRPAYPCSYLLPVMLHTCNKSATYFTTLAP